LEIGEGFVLLGLIEDFEIVEKCLNRASRYSKSAKESFNKVQFEFFFSRLKNEIKNRKSFYYFAQAKQNLNSHISYCRFR
jgi:hypothetical protein